MYLLPQFRHIFSILVLLLSDLLPSNNLPLCPLINLLPGFTIQDSEVLGIESAAKEAVLFALLANETLMDPSPSHDRRLGDSPWMTMGKISLPN